MLSIKSISIIILLSITILFIILSSQSPQIEELTSLCQTYFINLDENIERWNKIKHKNIKRFPAINGKTLDKKQLINDGIISKKNKLKMGQIGCALSHIEVLKLIAKQSEPYGLILEDDVVIPPDFNIHSLKLPKQFDIIFLGGCNIKGKKVSENLIKPTIQDGSYNLCWHSVLVNKKSAKKILKFLQPLYRPIDSQIRENYNKLDVFYHYPNLINQDKTLRSNRRDIDGLPQSSYWQKHHLDVSIY